MVSYCSRARGRPHPVAAAVPGILLFPVSLDSLRASQVVYTPLPRGFATIRFVWACVPRSDLGNETHGKGSTKRIPAR